MHAPSRRTLLCGAAGLFAAAAGCLDSAGIDPTADDDGAATDPDDGSDDSTGPDDGSDEATTTEIDEYDSVDAYETVSFQGSDVPAEPDARLLLDADQVDGWLEERGLDDEALVEFVDDTAFAESVVVALEADAPTLCYEMSLEELTLENPDEDDAQLALETVVSDGSGEMCGQQLTAVGRLVRVTFADEPVTSAAVTIVGHDDREHEMGMAADSASESTSGSERDADDN